jgi:hypothetical protein
MPFLLTGVVQEQDQVVHMVNQAQNQPANP